ncbi:MAG: S-adenosylmethionine:tRNA ribosyltransferase-isomerase, partial [Planctomycetota bacterium]
VERVEVTLHVGAGTFRPIESDRVEDHRMHREWCAMSAEAIRAVQSARAEGRRVIAVGTTSARTLESFARATADGSPPPEAIDTDLMIKPGDDWLWADGLLTNFHQPRTTLLLLVGSLLGGADGAGVRCLRDLYEQAVAHDYRFFSYGDAMLLLPD